MIVVFISPQMRDTCIAREGDDPHFIHKDVPRVELDGAATSIRNLDIDRVLTSIGKVMQRSPGGIPQWELVHRAVGVPYLPT